MPIAPGHGYADERTCGQGGAGFGGYGRPAYDDEPTVGRRHPYYDRDDRDRDSSEVTVEVSGGKVTLEGMVPERREHPQA